MFHKTRTRLPELQHLDGTRDQQSETSSPAVSCGGPRGAPGVGGLRVTEPYRCPGGLGVAVLQHQQPGTGPPSAPPDGALCPEPELGESTSVQYLYVFSNQIWFLVLAERCVSNNQFAEVNDGPLVCMAVLSPLSACTALLTVSRPDSRLHGPQDVAPGPEDGRAELALVVSSVLGVVRDIMEKEGDGEHEEWLLASVVYWCFHFIVETSPRLRTSDFSKIIDKFGVSGFIVT